MPSAQAWICPYTARAGTRHNASVTLLPSGSPTPHRSTKLYLQLLEEPGNYLKYYLGYLEICKLKESALALSSNWSLYDFHNWFLTTGPAPFSILTEHLEDLEISPKLLKRMSQDFHLLSVQPFHDGRNHFLMKRRMLLVG